MNKYKCLLYSDNQMGVIGIKFRNIHFLVNHDHR